MLQTARMEAGGGSGEQVVAVLAGLLDELHRLVLQPWRGLLQTQQLFSKAVRTVRGNRVANR